MIIMKYAKRIAVAVVLVICGVSMSGVMAQQPTPARRLRVIRYQGDLTMFLAAMPSAYGVTFGVELDAQPFRMVNVDVTDATLTDVMNAFVQSSKTFQWREADGFVDVWPSAGSSPLLDTRINNFSVKNVSASQALDQLFNLPEVQANMNALNLKRRAPDTPVKMSNSSFSVNVEGVSLRQALNKIAKESGIEIWIFRTYPNGFFSISTVEK